MRAVRLSDALKAPPEAWAEIRSGTAPHLWGSVRFHPWSRGTIVRSEFVNLPEPCRYYLKLPQDETEKTYGMARRMPRFFPDNGYSLFLFYADRITPEDLTGKKLLLCSPGTEGEPPAVIGEGIIRGKNYRR